MLCLDEAIEEDSPGGCGSQERPDCDWESRRCFWRRVGKDFVFQAQSEHTTLREKEGLAYTSQGGSDDFYVVGRGGGEEDTGGWFE